MRLALVTETYPPEINGVAMTIGRLVDGMRGRGHHVEVWRPRQANEPTEHTNGHDKLLPGIALIGYPDMQFGLPARSRLLRHWRRQRPDVVHVVTEGPLGWSAVSAARKLQLPVSSGFHTNFDRYSPHYGFGFLKPLVASYLRAFHRRTALTQVPTEAMAAELAGQGITPIRVVGRGVDTALFNPSRHSAELRKTWGEQGSLFCLYVGRLAVEKNLDLAVSAFKAIRQRRPDARMVWVGDGPARAKLQAEHPDHLFAGSRCSIDLAEHYASADMFLFPSLTETYGNVIAEAMASGLPVVAFRSAAAAELIADGQNGRSVQPADNQAFIDAAVELACDDVQRKQIGELAAQGMTTRGWDGVVGRFEDVLHGLIQA